MLTSPLLEAVETKYLYTYNNGQSILIMCEFGYLLTEKKIKFHNGKKKKEKKNLQVQNYSLSELPACCSFLPHIHFTQPLASNFMHLLTNHSQVYPYSGILSIFHI